MAKVDRRAVKLLPETIARRYHVLPILVTEAFITVATTDPTDLEALSDLEFASGRHVQYAVADPDAIDEQLIAEYAPEHAIDAVVNGFGSDQAAIVVEEEIAREQPASEATAGAVRRLTATLLRDAVVQGASDIHLTQQGALGLVRYRIDGLMRQVLTMPGAVFLRVVSRLKVISGLDITERMRPQDGRSRILVDEKTYDLRISTLPVEGGSERVVVRLLPHDGVASLDAMDIAEPERQQLLALLGQNDGLVLLTGPTGSGKTTTLHAALTHRRSEEVTIMTVENPVEYRIAGISQVQVEPKQGLTFASALRAMLRQDPDIILVGEIRDAETAETATQAASTGHLVLSTVHADDAPSVVLRLRGLGLGHDVIAQCFRGVAAQRLLRRLCTDCKQPLVDPSEHDQEFLAAHGTPAPMRAVGCARCAFTGYRGRLPIHQVLIVDQAVRTLLADGADTEAIRVAARATGMRSLGESAASRILAGETTPAEAVRILGQRFWDEIHGRPSTAVPVTEYDESSEVPPSVGEAPTETGGSPRVLIFSLSADVAAALTAACVSAGGEPVVVSRVEDAVRLGRGAEGIRLLVLHLDAAPDAPPVEAAGLLVDLRRGLGELTLPSVLVAPDHNPVVTPMLQAAGFDDYVLWPKDADSVGRRIGAALRRSTQALAPITA